MSYLWHLTYWCNLSHVHFLMPRNMHMRLPQLVLFFLCSIWWRHHRSLQNTSPTANLALWNLWSPSPRWDWVRGSISKFRTVCVANISLAIAHQVPEGVQSAPASAGCTHHWLPHHRWHTKVPETFWSYQIIQISAKHVMIIYYGLFSFHSYFCVHS